jgi:hypothetical protein
VCRAIRTLSISLPPNDYFMTTLSIALERYGRESSRITFGSMSSAMPDTARHPNSRPGSEPDASATDALIRRFVSNWTMSIEAQGQPLGGRTLRCDDLAAVDVGRPAFGGNVATLLAPLTPENVADVVATLDDFYRFSAGANAGTVFIFSPWPTPDLEPYGWSFLEEAPLMLRPPGDALPPIPPGLLIEPVHDAAGMRAFEIAIVRGFSAPELGAQGAGAVFSPGMLGDARCRFWVGHEGDRPVSAAATFVADGINNVTLVATVPDARRRGYGAAVTWHATLADPALPAMLIATDEGRPVYERMGYTTVSHFTLWSRDRPDSEDKPGT